MTILVSCRPNVRIIQNHFIRRCAVCWSFLFSRFFGTRPEPTRSCSLGSTCWASCRSIGIVSVDAITYTRRRSFNCYIDVLIIFGVGPLNTFIYSQMMTWETWWHHTRYPCCWHTINHVHWTKTTTLLRPPPPPPPTTTTTTTTPPTYHTSQTTSNNFQGPLGPSFIPSCSFQWSYRIDGLVARYTIPNWWTLWCSADAFAFGSSRRSSGDDTTALEAEGTGDGARSLDAKSLTLCYSVFFRWFKDVWRRWNTANGVKSQIFFEGALSMLNTGGCA